MRHHGVRLTETFLELENEIDNFASQTDPGGGRIG
jgi:hypothetical protein